MELYAEQVVKAREMLHSDLKEVREALHKRDRVAAMNRLEGDLDTVMDTFEEAARGRENEALSAREAFDLRCRRLLGLAGEMTALSRKRPEARCNAFKLSQINGILHPLRDELAENMDEALPPVDEDAVLSYSDLSLLIRNVLDLSIVYARRHYGLRYEEIRY